MKSRTLYIAILLHALCVNAQIRPTPHEWRATLKVVDENGEPVPNAKVSVLFDSASPQGKPVSDNITGLTDRNGIFSASHTDRSVNLAFCAEKSAYYPFSMTHFLGYEERKNTDWNPSRTLVLKRIRNPIPMYAKMVNLAMPAFDKPIGFDLMAGDWIAPYGTGRDTDMIFTAHLEKRSDNDSDYKLTVSFPREGDGIQEFTVPPTVFPTEGSKLRSTHEAPTNSYEPQWIQTRTRKPGQPNGGNLDKNRNYFFRVHTVLDEHRNVKSALYGKIYRDFMHFSYYLNPSPNDRNLEFDPKKNLLHSPKSFEQVSEP